MLVNPGDTKNCVDFSSWDAANVFFWTYYDRYGDVAKLDGDNNLTRASHSSRPPIPASRSNPVTDSRAWRPGR